MISDGINQFIFKGKRSYDDFSMIITETPPEEIAERDLEFVSVNGRNGDIVYDNGRYKNVTREYKVTALAERYPLPLLIRKIASWLESDVGYHILSDTYDPNYFRYACYNGKVSFTEKMMQLGAATIRFNCKPFRYSFDGQRPIKIGKIGSIWNFEDIESSPYIKIIGSGNCSLIVNGIYFPFLNVEDYIEIDSESMSAFKGELLQNHKIQFDDFPKFKPGINNIFSAGNISEILIIPRWCSL